MLFVMSVRRRKDMKSPAQSPAQSSGSVHGPGFKQKTETTCVHVSPRTPDSREALAWQGWSWSGVAGLLKGHSVELEECAHV